MKSIFVKIHKQIENFTYQKQLLFNKKLTTYIYNYYSDYNNCLTNLSNAFKDIFTDTIGRNYLNAYIIQDNSIFSMLNNCLSKFELFDTDITKKFNTATQSTSIIKCTKNRNYYIMKCYDYFFYLFDKTSKECIMVLSNNKKAITMINILLLTPYLMCGELNAIHGGLVSKDNQNILINNTSLGGKTSFAILFANNGWDIITEENTYISKRGDILTYNIRNYFNIRVGTYLAFEDFFLKKGISHEPFLSMKGKNDDELYEYAKSNQLSVDFEKLGKDSKLNNRKITHSLKVSILKNTPLTINKTSTQSLVDSFIELSTSPTVELFQELLHLKSLDLNKRRNNLKNSLKNVHSFIIKTNLKYKENFEYIKNSINIK